MQVEINIENVKKLINTKFRGNISWFANEIQVDRSYLSTILNKKKSIKSKKIILGIITYCIENGIDYNNYVYFFNVSVRKN